MGASKQLLSYQDNILSAQIQIAQSAQEFDQLKNTQKYKTTNVRARCTIKGLALKHTIPGMWKYKCRQALLNDAAKFEWE